MLPNGACKVRNYNGSIVFHNLLTFPDEILKPKSQSRLSEAEFSQPCCTAIQIALVDLLKSWNIKPAAVVGHSSGEIGAAYASDVLTAPEAILVAYYRGLATLGLGKPHRGSMAAIGLGRDQVTPYLRTGVIIGCENSRSSTTLTGDSDTLEQVMLDIQTGNPEVLVRVLKVECAYHSSKSLSTCSVHMPAISVSIALAIVTNTRIIQTI